MKRARTVEQWLQLWKSPAQLAGRLVKNIYADVPGELLMDDPAKSASKAVPGNQVGNQSTEFTEQARWLIEWHNRRSEAMATRAASLLGFIGVILALLLQNATNDVRPGVLVFVLFGLTVAGLGVASVFSVLTLRPRSVGMPEPNNFRAWWDEYAALPQTATSPDPKITESLIGATGEAERSPLLSAGNEANNRAECFEVAAWSLLLSLIPLVALVVTVISQGR